MDTIEGLRTNGPAIIGTGVAFTVLAALTTVMRVASKLVTRAPFAFDDWTVFLAFVLYLTSEILVIRSDIIGRLGSSVTDAALSTYGLYVYIYSIFYFSIIALCIISILILYRRIFPSSFMIKATTVLLVTVVCWWVPPTIIQIGKPTEDETFPGDPDQKDWHINYLSYWLAVGIIEQCLIIAAILLPTVQVYRLQLDLRKRLLLTVIFSVSYVCVITGIIRMAMLYRPSQPDIDLSLGDVWINVHTGTAIMAVNLPICWPLISHRAEILDRLSSGRGRSRTVGHSTSAGQASRKSVRALDRITTGASGEETGLPGTDGASDHTTDKTFAARRLDPRGSGTTSLARRVDSDDSDGSAWKRGMDLEMGEGINVRQTVRVETT